MTLESNEKFYLSDTPLDGINIFGKEVRRHRTPGHYSVKLERGPRLHLMRRRMLFGCIPWGWRTVLQDYIYEKQEPKGFWRDRIVSLSNVSDEQIAEAKADLMSQYEEKKARCTAIVQEAEEARKRKGFV